MIVIIQLNVKFAKTSYFPLVVNRHLSFKGKWKRRAYMEGKRKSMEKRSEYQRNLFSWTFSKSLGNPMYSVIRAYSIYCKLARYV